MQDQVFATIQKYLAGPFRHLGGGNVLTRCPFHKEGKEAKPSFSVNLETGLFHCFTGGCQVAGGLQYLLHLLGLPRERIDAELASIKPILEKNRETFLLEKKNVFKDKNPFKADYILPESILGVYEWAPTKLIEAGFDMNLLRDLEIGFDKTNERIMYPLRDLYGNLAGFSGGAQHSWQQPKYHVYQGRRKANNRWVDGDFGQWFDQQFPDYRCENHDFLWNFNRVYPRLFEAVSDPNATVILVEGFKACMWLLQAGYMNTVALMGSYISERQQLMLHRLNVNVVLFLDNDKAGREAAVWVGEHLWRPMHGRVTVVQYPEEDAEENTQPDDYFPDGIHQMLQQRVSLQQYVTKETMRNPVLKQKIERKRRYPNGNERISS